MSRRKFALIDVYHDGQVLRLVKDTGKDLDTILVAWFKQDRAYCDGEIHDEKWIALTPWLARHGVDVLPMRQLCL